MVVVPVQVSIFTHRSLVLAVKKNQRCLKPKHKLRILQRNKSIKRAAYENPDSKGQIPFGMMVRQGIRSRLGHDPRGRRDGAQRKKTKRIEQKEAKRDQKLGL